LKADRSNVSPDVRPLRVLSKALIIFVVLNLAFASMNPPVGRLSVYNWLVGGRQRFPTGRGPGSYNVTIDDLEALFASHVISGVPKSTGEYRVFVLGDSQTWGWTLTAPQTLAERLNAANLTACGRRLQFYNLAYPAPSVLRDLLILNKGLQYNPDLVVWLVTADSFRRQSLPAGTFANNPEPLNDILRRYGLNRETNLVDRAPTFVQRTLVGQRAQLAKFALLQVYGLLWGATGIDVRITKYPALATDVPASENYGGLRPPKLPASAMEFGVLEAAHKMIGELPVLLINEPIYMAPGKNSDIRYSGKYPRWAYDQYRELLPGLAAQEGWQYLDLYNLIPYREFADPALHLTPNAEKKLAKALSPEILRTDCP
jgi:hypothetical protein